MNPVGQEPPEVHDSSGHQNHASIRNRGHVKKDQPPIIGPGRSYHLTSPGHLELGTLGEFASRMAAGFYLGFDIQLEGSAEQTLCGTQDGNRTALLVTYNANRERHRLAVTVRDEQGKTLSGYAQLSKLSAKRVLISVDPSTNGLGISEINLCRADVTRQVVFLARNRPVAFNTFRHPFLFGGHNIDGQVRCYFRGRVSQLFAVPEKVLSSSKLTLLADTSWSDIEGRYGQRLVLPANNERRELFVDDVGKLRPFATRDLLSKAEMRDASVVLYRWLFDTHPVLQDICDELGIQLSLPGDSARTKLYNRQIVADQPIYAQSLRLGRNALFGFDWVPLKEFGDGGAFIVNGHSVAHEAFVKFVRNKLGGGHYDPRDRTKWQKDLAALSVYVGDEPALNHHMKHLIGAILDALDSCGILQQLTP